MVQVVLLTGHGSRQDAEEGRQLGAFKYLMKPVKIEDLIGVLKAATVFAVSLPPDVRLVVNLSARQLQHDGLVGDVRELLEGLGLAGEALNFWLTEGLLMEEATDAALEALGAWFTVDPVSAAHRGLAGAQHFREPLGAPGFRAHDPALASGRQADLGAGLQLAVAEHVELRFEGRGKVCRCGDRIDEFCLVHLFNLLSGVRIATNPIFIRAAIKLRQLP